MKRDALYDEIISEPGESWGVSESAVRRFRESLPNILALVNEKFRLEAPYRENLDFLMDAHSHFGEMISAVYQFQLWRSLIDEAAWYAQSIRSRGLGARYFSQMLRTWMISLYSFIRPPEVNELVKPLNWLSGHTQDLFQLDKQEEALSDRASRLLDFLFRNKKREAGELVNSFSHEQGSDEALINRLFLPVLLEIGRLWRDNQISVADEHLAVANLRAIYQAFFKSRSPGAIRDQRITVCCVPGEEHETGAELLSLYLENKGWPITFVGQSTPEDEILRMVEQNTPFALILSVTLISHLPALVSLAQRLREHLPSMRILAGGRAIRQAKEVIQNYVDGTPYSFEECQKALDDMVKAYA